MREELTIVKIEAISDPGKKAFSGVMGITPYFMDWDQEECVLGVGEAGGRGPNRDTKNN